ncbi:hypothetical protein IE077_001748 [Cardiosporidium cionae]|uniref:K Homology domain-containing protein n=1 Tax=Cardiosporidium cionae TaxID=476202 RepID=A0ABQ7JDF4_9APIC|nr:hypothetical protein IE077_001748 [Cardiosporidium cionae]|eukprot:KAF8821665.1 hypothetical protein IE077_001748 [Cardiosporidium cionae]
MAALNLFSELGFPGQFNEDSYMLGIPHKNDVFRNSTMYTKKCVPDVLSPAPLQCPSEREYSLDNSFFSSSILPWSSDETMKKSSSQCDGIDNSCSFREQIPLRKPVKNLLQHSLFAVEKLFRERQSYPKATVSTDVESLSDSTVFQSPIQRLCDRAHSSETTTIVSNYDESSDHASSNISYSVAEGALRSPLKSRRLEILNRLGYWINWSLEMQSMCSRVYKLLLEEIEGDKAPYLDPIERECITSFLLAEATRCGNTSPLSCVDLRSKIHNSFLKEDLVDYSLIKLNTINRVESQAISGNGKFKEDDRVGIEVMASNDVIGKPDVTKQLISKLSQDNGRKSMDVKCNSSDISTVESITDIPHSNHERDSPKIQQMPFHNASIKRPLWSFPKEWSDYNFPYARGMTKPSQLKFLASANVVGKLFDYNGENIRMLQSRFKVRISTSGNRVFYPGTGKQVLLIKGQLMDILHALRTVFVMMVPDVLEVDNMSTNFDASIIRFELSVVIPSTTSNKILSSKGTQIQWIQKRTNARIHVTCMRFELGDVQERLMTINGLQTEVEQTVELVSMVIQEDVIGDAYSFLNYPLYTKAHMN